MKYLAVILTTTLLLFSCSPQFNRIDYGARTMMIFVGDRAQLSSQDGARLLGMAAPGDTLWIIGELREKNSGAPSYYLTMSQGERARVNAAACLSLEDYAHLRSQPDAGGTATGSGRILLTGPRGGVYYINSHGNKTYVKKNTAPGGSSTKPRKKN